MFWLSPGPCRRGDRNIFSARLSRARLIEVIQYAKRSSSLRHGVERTKLMNFRVGPGNGRSGAMKIRCCIVGGGPAGMMLGYLLGRAGVDVVVLEKHADFFRDFRGDTVHPSTLQVMDELGLIDGFLKLPHQRLQKMEGMFGGEDGADRRSRPAQRQISLHRLHAAMGLSQFPARERQTIPFAEGDDVRPKRSISSGTAIASKA